ncbi:RidA family protein [Rhodococcus sp. NPDC057297]|uniref:RidA family protein n=1 Tax=Rhodococcus sp. NPDC057297 TaxID=3346090 RepID=UPI00362BE142
MTDTNRREINAPDIPAPRGHFAHAVSVEGAGPPIYISGLLALDSDGLIVGPNDAEMQTTRILDSLESILAAAGTSVDRLVKLTVYVTDIDDRAAISALRRTRWPNIKPASTLVEVSGLAADGAVVEIDAIAASPQSTPEAVR